MGSSREDFKDTNFGSRSRQCYPENQECVELDLNMFALDLCLSAEWSLVPSEERGYRAFFQDIL